MPISDICTDPCVFLNTVNIKTAFKWQSNYSDLSCLLGHVNHASVSVAEVLHDYLPVCELNPPSLFC